MNTWNGYEKGINLGGWLSQCIHTTEHYESFITERDIKLISTWDIDHVRVPIDYNLLQDMNGNFIASGFDYLDRLLHWCNTYHLNAIFDLHKAAGFSFDDGEQEMGFFETPSLQEHFYALWEELSRRYGSFKDRLAFELLNEVTERDFMDEWLRISNTCIQKIRAIAPDIDILVGGYWNNSILSIPSLATPQDAHIVYNFHCYEPLIFTHQGAYWVKGMASDFRVPIRQSYQALQNSTKEVLNEQFDIFYREDDLTKTFDENFFIHLFEEAVRIANERNVRLYCGEYGVIDLTDTQEGKYWYDCIHKAFDHCHIGRAAWSYKDMDFNNLEKGYIR